MKKFNYKAGDFTKTLIFDHPSHKMPLNVEGGIDNNHNSLESCDRLTEI